jgi:hypothetical protein
VLLRAVAALVVLGGTALAVAGCGAAPAAPRTAAPTPTPTVAPLPTPSPAADEVTRSTLTGAAAAEPAGAMPAAGPLAVDVACTGVDGSTMAWRLEAGDGTPLGLAGEADCSGPPTTQWLGVTAAQRPARVRVHLQPASGVVGGYAIVRSGSF